MAEAGGQEGGRWLLAPEGEKLQQPVGYSWGGGTAGTQRQGVGRGLTPWDGSQPVQRSLYMGP